MTFARSLKSPTRATHSIPRCLPRFRTMAMRFHRVGLASNSLPAANSCARGGGAAARPAETPRQIENQRDYLRHVTAVDAGLGRLLDALERSGRAGNTLVILTSDNGYYLGEHGLGDKRSAYDESLRVPLLVRLPNCYALRLGSLVSLCPWSTRLLSVPHPRLSNVCCFPGLGFPRHPQLQIYPFSLDGNLPCLVG